jgi:hypothetical protein
MIIFYFGILNPNSGLPSLLDPSLGVGEVGQESDAISFQTPYPDAASPFNRMARESIGAKRFINDRD